MDAKLCNMFALASMAVEDTDERAVARAAKRVADKAAVLIFALDVGAVRSASGSARCSRETLTGATPCRVMVPMRAGSNVVRSTESRILPSSGLGM